MRVIAFTRHALTPAQQGTFANWAVTDHSVNARRVLLTDDDAAAVVRNWLKGETETIYIYGVFPPILRAWLHDQNTGAHGVCVTTYEWHNTSRAAEGQSPTAETLGGNRWVETGQYFIDLCEFE